MRTQCATCCVLLLVAVATESQPVAAKEMPDRYVLAYPAAQQFCPPIAGFFDEVQRTIDRVGYRTFSHQPNGGYGLPVQDMVGGAHLLHLGADVGWYRVGEPVFAIAGGVVRISEGPPKDHDKKKPILSKILAWGNLVVLEHRLPDGKHATTIYGHLANERLVNVGDVVEAGQQIGTIGTTRVNGGYKPHLHLGVREGRMAEVGRKLLLMTTDGNPTVLQISEVHDDAIVLTGGKDLPKQLTMGLDGRKFQLKKQDDKVEVKAALLYYVPSSEFLIVGYGLSTDGWVDPILFLKRHGADINPAPFTRVPRKSQTHAAGGLGSRRNVAAAKD